MKKRKVHEFRAATLAEMLVVIVVSGILFIALFDGVNLVKRYTNRLNRSLSTGHSLLDDFQQMDHLFRTSDSVLFLEEKFHFYRAGERCALGEVQDSLWLCTRENKIDTLFRGVMETRVIPGNEFFARVDSLGIRFRYRGKELYFIFGRENRAEEDWEVCAEEVENQFKKEDDDDLE